MLKINTSKIANVVESSTESLGYRYLLPIKNELNRSPKNADEFVPAAFEPKVNSYKQLIAKLNRVLNSFFIGKEEILKNTNKGNADTILKLAQLKDNYGIPGYIIRLKDLAPLITTENKGAIEKLVKSNGLNLRTTDGLLEKLKYQHELTYKIDDISDPKILKYIKENNTIICDCDNNLVKVNDVLDIYHTFKGDYSHIGKRIKYGWQVECVDMPCNQEYYNFYKKRENLSLRNDLNGTTTGKDLWYEARTERMRNFCDKNPDDKMSNYFYNEYYLKSNMVPDEVRAKCAEINEKFGTKIFLSSNHKEDSAVLEYVKQELREWQKASGGEAKTPPTLDFSVIRREYIDGGSAFGQGASGGLQNVETRAISIDGTRLEAVKYAIRHELTHANSTNDGLNIGTKHNLDEIMPRKLNKDRMVVPDIENCKYKQEFYNAGISKEQTEYAHNSPEEFIAVASEGDMSKYSPEFKQILVDFGMPKWMFKMKPKNEIAKGLVV